MRSLALLFLLCAPAARAADDAAAKALARVRAEEAKLRQQSLENQQAQEKKSEAAKRATDAVRHYNDLPDWRFVSKGIAEGKASRAKLEFQAAREAANAAQGEYLQVGRGYIDAENDYRQASGGYYNEQQYNHVREVIKVTGGPAAGDPPASSEQVQQEAANLQKLAAGGKLSAGELAAHGQNLGRMGDDIMAQALTSNFGAAGAGRGAPGGASGGGAGGASGGESYGGGSAAAGSIGYGRAAPPPDALRVDKAILLSQPSGGTRAASSGRFLSAGAERLSSNDPRGALAAAEAALKEDPRNAKAWGLKAAALNQMRRFGEAELAAKRAVELDRGNAQGYRDLAWAQLHNGKADDAEASATRMIFLEPENAEGYLLRAFAYELKGDRTRMLADLARAAALDPKYANHLARAKAGERLFDPDFPGTDSLLNALSPPPPPRSNAMTWFGALLLAAAGLGAGVPKLLAVWARYKNSRHIGPGRKPDPSAPARATAAPAAPAAEEGLLAGKYRLRRVAGRGGMGQVWEALDTTLERTVAVKEMSPELASDPALRVLYLMEARTIATLRHPNIVEIYEILDLPPQLYLVFEWVSGKTVAQVLIEKKRLSLDTVKAVMAPVCEALAFAHERGVVHRDLKPANVMVSGDGHVKLMDFGIARALGEAAAHAPAQVAATAGPAAAMARTRTVAGTPGYRPPDAEQGLVTPGFDIYCVGVCLYEMLSGELPYGDTGWTPGKTYEPLSKKVPGLPEALDDILARALEPDQAKRLSDARALKAALLRL